MPDANNDPIGHAILDYNENGTDDGIIVSSDICDDDVIYASYLCRSYEEMPAREQLALAKCDGKILDIGAGAGSHATYLQTKGHDVICMEISSKAIAYMKTNGLKVESCDFFDYNKSGYDTLLMLMNGIGIARNLANLEATLLKAKSLLRKNGKIICDSSDIKYLYQDDDGGNWTDLNSDYYGNFKFQMKYKEHVTNWFEWLYVDFDRLATAGKNTGYKIEKLYEDDNQYLAQLTLK